jgi:Protein of unknown function (DUF2505)
VKFTITQVFDTTAAELVTAFTDPSYLAAMGGLKDLGAPELITQTRTGDVVSQQLRTSFVGKLPSVALKVIDPARLSWDEFADINLATETATFRMVPVHYQHYFRCSGTWTITERSTGTGQSAVIQATRTIQAELKVSSPIPFVNGQVERAIVSALRERLRDEPSVYRAWLNQ